MNFATEMSYFINKSERTYGQTDDCGKN